MARRTQHSPVASLYFSGQKGETRSQLDSLSKCEARGCPMDDLEGELSALKHTLAQLERGELYKQWAAPHVDALAVVKAGYRRKIAGLNQRLAPSTRSRRS